MGYKIIVERGYLRFSAAHFITFGGKCERLHGHNYTISVGLEGDLTTDAYLFDFVALKDIARHVCEALDHRILLPSHNEHLTLREGENEWEALFQEQRYLFPARDVLVLPVDNITAERLAEYICGQIKEELTGQVTGHIETIVVGVEESPGQTAFYRERFAQGTGATLEG